MEHKQSSIPKCREDTQRWQQQRGPHRHLALAPASTNCRLLHHRRRRQQEPAHSTKQQQLKKFPRQDQEFNNRRTYSFNSLSSWTIIAQPLQTRRRIGRAHRRTTELWQRLLCRCRRRLVRDGAAAAPCSSSAAAAPCSSAAAAAVLLLRRALCRCSATAAPNSSSSAAARLLQSGGEVDNQRERDPSDCIGEDQEIRERERGRGDRPMGESQRGIGSFVDPTDQRGRRTVTAKDLNRKTHGSNL